MLAAVGSRAQTDAGSNALVAQSWYLADFEIASARLDLHLWCPWTTATNHSSWFFRHGPTNKAARLGIDSRTRYALTGSSDMGNFSDIKIEYRRTDDATNIEFEVHWKGFSGGKPQLVSKRLSIPSGQSSTGAVEYVNYHTWGIIIPWGKDATSRDVERLSYRADWTMTPRIGPMW